MSNYYAGQCNLLSCIMEKMKKGGNRQGYLKEYQQKRNPEKDSSDQDTRKYRNTHIYTKYTFLQKVLTQPNVNKLYVIIPTPIEEIFYI